MQLDDEALGQQVVNSEVSDDNAVSEQEVVDARDHQNESSPAIEGAHDVIGRQEESPEVTTITGEADDEAASLGVPGEPLADDEAQTDEPAPTMEEWLEAGDSMQTIKRGEILEGTVIRVGPGELLIDVGAKTEGIVPSRELDRMDPETLASLEVGSSVPVYILTPEDRSGNILLSLSRADEERDWIEAERHMAEGLTYESTVSGFNKGGLIVRFGHLRGFVPASQVSVNRRRRSVGSTPEERWGSMLHDPIIVKAIEVDRERNRLILSERAAAKENRAARKATLLEKLEVGEVTSGRVISLTDFGAFVDLGGADGLVHLSELSWRHVTHPKEVLSVGDEVEVEIISLDREHQRIGLSLKRLKDDPWAVIASRYEVGQLVQGTVTKLTKFGAFARLVDAPEIEGLIHISELSDQRVKHPHDVVDENEVLTLRIVRIDPDKRRMGLSLKRVDSEAYLDTDWQIMTADINSEDAADAEAQAEPETVAAEEPAAELEVETEAETGAAEEPAAELEVETEAETGAAEEPAAGLEVESEAEPNATQEPVAETEEETGPEEPD